MTFRLQETLALFVAFTRCVPSPYSPRRAVPVKKKQRLFKPRTKTGGFVTGITRSIYMRACGTLPLPLPLFPSRPPPSPLFSSVYPPGFVPGHAVCLPVQAFDDALNTHTRKPVDGVEVRGELFAASQ